MLKLNNEEIIALYLGTIQLEKLYLGTTLLYQKDEPIEENNYILIDSNSALLSADNTIFIYTNTPQVLENNITPNN